MRVPFFDKLIVKDKIDLFFLKFANTLFACESDIIFHHKDCANLWKCKIFLNHLYGTFRNFSTIKINEI